VPRRGQRDAKSGRPERPQTPQCEREADGARLTRQSLDPVRGIVLDDGRGGVVR